MYVAMQSSEPIGFAQSYTALGCGDGWWEDETDPGVRGIDQSLANPMQLSQGLGTKLVRALVERLFEDPKAMLNKPAKSAHSWARSKQSQQTAMPFRNAAPNRPQRPK
jgi:hypothetical protein